MASSRLLPENPRTRAVVFGVAAAVLLLVVTQFVMPGSGGGSGRGTPAAILFQGFVTGLVTSLFTTGIILIYRTLRIINFAQGPLGAVGATLAVQLMAFTPVPFPVSLLLMLLVSGLLGAVVGFFMLRFFNSSRLFLTVVTIAGAQVFGGALFFVLRLPFFPNFNLRTQAQNDIVAHPDQLMPFRGFHFEVGSLPLQFGFAHVFAIEMAAVALLAVAFFLRYTRSGVAVRAIAENPERASLLGIGVASLSVVVWIIAGMLDGVGAFLTSTAAPGIGGGYQALAIPLAAAVIARFRNIAVGVAAAIGLGVLRDAWTFSLKKDTDIFTVALFAIVLVGLFLQRRGYQRSEAGADVSWSATAEPRVIPRELREISGIRLARIGMIAVGSLAVVLFPFIASTNRTVLGGTIAVRAIAVLSLVVLTGWAGQVSLGQWGIVAVGSVVGGALTDRAGIPFWFAVPLVVALTAGLSVVIGLPALRIKGLFLLVTTFLFAIAVQAVLFNDRYFGWLLPEQVKRPTLFFINFEDERSMYFLCVAALVLSIVVVGNMRRSRVGRLLIALRENEANVQAFGVSALRAKLMAFAVSGGLAGFAGVVFAHQQRGVSAESFIAQRNVELFLQAVVGGVSSAGGALLGAAWGQIPDEFLRNQEVVSTFYSSGGPLLLLFVAPGGLISLVNAMRDSVLRVVAQRRRIVVPSLFADYDPKVLARRLIPLAEADPTSGLGALPLDERFVLASELYQGSGERIVDRLEPVEAEEDTAAFRAAANSIEEATLDELDARAAVATTGDAGAGES